MEEKRSHRRTWTVIMVVVAGLICTTVPLWAAYQVQRPITVDGGQVYQGYLYGEVYVWPTATPGATPAPTPRPTLVHHGVDFGYDTGTAVYAVAEGEVRDYREDVDNGTGSGFGNYVLIRHEQPAWDGIHDQFAYVYSLYAHLAYDSVNVDVGGLVSPDTHIADVDNTGTSTGDHLHLQIVLHQLPDRVKDNLEADARSRNPELWLQPYEQNTGIVVGKLTYPSGNPIGDSHRIYGLSKPYGGYLWSQTYSFAGINPDDILVDNWATTDVEPDTYDLEARDSGGGFFRNLGPHTVRAEEITYVDLYPFYLPFANWSDWSSYTWVRNNDASDTSQLNVTYFGVGGGGVSQDTSYTPPETVYIPSSGALTGSGVAVSSERSAVVVLPQRYEGVYAYTGVPADSGLTGFPEGSDLGLSQATTLVMPNFLNDYWGWSSKIYVQNSGRARTDIHIIYRYYDDQGQYQECVRSCPDVRPWGRCEHSPNCGPSLPSFRITLVSASIPYRPFNRTTLSFDHRRSWFFPGSAGSPDGVPISWSRTRATSPRTSISISTRCPGSKWRTRTSRQRCLAMDMWTSMITSPSALKARW